MLPFGVRLAAAAAVAVAVAVAAAARPARADDPRELFGLGKGAAEEPAASCAPGDPGTHDLVFGCPLPADPLSPLTPFALRTWLPADYLLSLPVADARHDAVAHYGVGAGRDDAGPTFGGATGLENRWTIEGAPADSIRTGGVDTRVPLTFMEGMAIVAGGFSARDRASFGGTIDVRLRRGGDTHEAEAHAWGGLTGAPRQRPIADATYQLRRLRAELGPDASASVVATGPLPRLAGGKTWYAAGIAPALVRVDYTWTDTRLVDLDGDGIPDGLPGRTVLQPIRDPVTETTTDYLVPMMARAGWERGAHAVDLTLIGHAGRDSVFQPLATLQAAGVDRTAWVGDGIATWRGTWPSTRARAQLAWHRSVRREAAHDPAAAALPASLTAYVPTTLAEDPALAAACSDADPATDPWPTITNCPVPFGFFSAGGAGLLADAVGDRPSMTADVAHRRGRHVMRAGATFEDTRLVTTSRFTGGYLDRSLFDGHVDRSRFYAGSCGAMPDEPCAYADELELSYRTRYTAAYVEDTFTPVPGLEVTGGLRWELMWVGPRLHFSDQLAPRLGMTYDVLGGGRSRLWATMGRSFLQLPAGLGSTVIARNTIVRDVDAGALGMSRNLSRGNVYTVAAGVEPPTQDEVTVGFEVGRVKALRAQVWVQHRSLRRGLETVRARAAEYAVAFDNPGRTGTMPSARREATIVAAELATDPTAKLAVRATYLYGRVVGNWVGMYDPRQGVTLLAGTDFDIDATNLSGRLPTDPGHRVAVEVVRRGSVAGVPLGVAARLTVNSGRPRSILANDPEAGLVYVEPRGSAGRLPMVSQANVRLASRVRGFDVTLDVFNAFDRTTETARDELFADGSRPRTAYGLPTAFQAPIAATLGVHRMF